MNGGNDRNRNRGRSRSRDGRSGSQSWVDDEAGEDTEEEKLEVAVGGAGDGPGVAH